MNQHRKEVDAEIIPRGVYFIYAPNQNKIKIGRSKNIESRFTQLRTGFMDEGILLFGIITTEEVDLEADLHREFAHLRDSGEWFILTKELLRLIENRNFIYSEIKEYNRIEQIRNTLAYKSLGMFKLVTTLKEIQNRYIVPIFLFCVGLIFAYNNYRLESELDHPDIFRYHSYLIMVIYPIMTPILARNILAYSSVRTGIIFLLIVLLGISIEFINLLTPIQDEILKTIRVLLVSSYLPFMKNVLMVNWVRMRDEKLSSDAIQDFRKGLSYDKLLDLKKAFENRYKKLQDSLYRFAFRCAVVTYVSLNLYLIISNLHEIESRVLILIILNIGGLIWSFLDRSKNDSLNKLTHYVFPITLLIIQILAKLMEPETGLFEIVIAIVVTIIAPALGYGVYVALHQKKLEIQLKEINAIIYKD